jgi:hypothetical protein
MVTPLAQRRMVDHRYHREKHLCLQHAGNAHEADLRHDFHFVQKFDQDVTRISLFQPKQAGIFAPINEFLPDCSYCLEALQ